MRRAAARRSSSGARVRRSPPGRAARRATARLAAPIRRATCRRSTRRSSTGSVRPPRRSAPGNRGLEYGTDAGTPVAAVGRRSRDLRRLGGRHAARHGAPRRRRAHHLLVPRRSTSSSGSAVRQGDQVGAHRRPPPPRRAARRQLLRPGVAVRAGAPSVHLVPFDEPPGEGERGSAAPSASSSTAPVGSSTARRGRRGRRHAGCATAGRSCSAPLDHYGRRFTFPASFVDSWSTIAPGLAARPCGRRPPVHRGRRAGAAAGRAPGRGARRRARIATAPRSTVDQVRTDELGYATPDVLRFSYAGGRVPDPTDGFASIAGVRRTAPPRPRPTSASPAAGSPTWSSRSPPALRACRSTSSPTPRAGSWRGWP